MYTSKDLARINGITAKPNPIDAAQRMANTIKNSNKAIQRGLAAKSLDEIQIANIFLNKARQLGGDVDTALKTPMRILGSELPFDEQYKSNRRSRMRSAPSFIQGNPVLPCGKLNLQTGENRYFNVKTNGLSCIEVWKCGNPSYNRKNNKWIYKYVITSGSNPLFQIGDTYFFIHDQTRKFLFDGEMVDYINADSMILLQEKYGSRYCYVYK